MMLFNVGDWVVHPLHGVGQVIGVERKPLAQEAQLYYEIAIVKGTLWVAVEMPPAGLRGVTTKGDLPRYRTVLKSAPGLLNKDYHQRRGEVVRDLTAYGWLKGLSEVDAGLLRRAHDSLCQEWATAEAVTVVEAAQEVEALLREARQVYQK
jgi:RNA polymerase-interacting CarD/CdnL/TRCF family regulator